MSQIDLLRSPVAIQFGDEAIKGKKDENEWDWLLCTSAENRDSRIYIPTPRL